MKLLKSEGVTFAMQMKYNSDDLHKLLRQMQFAGACVIVLLVCAAALNFALSAALLQVILAVNIICGVAVLWTGRNIIANGLRKIASGEPSIDSLVAIGSVAAFIHGAYWLVWQLLGGSAAYGAVYFVPMAIIVFAALCGRYFKLLAGDEAAEPRELAEILVPACMGIAVLAGFSWYFYNGDSSMGWTIFTACLLMGCPVTVSLARPVALLKGLAAAAKRGADVQHSRALALNEAKDLTLAVLCDRGTVSDEKIKPTDVVAVSGSSEQRILNLAVSLSQYDECKNEPMSLALAEEAVACGVRGDLPCSDFIYERNAGIRARCQRVKVGLGDAGYIKKLCRLSKEAAQQANALAKDGKTVLFLAADGHLCGIFAFAYLPKAGSKAEIKKLQDCGLRTMLVTERSTSAGAFTAGLAGIGKVAADLNPSEKGELVTSMQLGGERCCVIGSNSDDFPALKNAGISVAGSCSEEAARSICDISIKNNIGTMADVIEVSRKIAQIKRQNFYFALVFNIVGLPMATGIAYALGGELPNSFMLTLPVLLGSLCILLNSMRIR